MTNRVPLAPLLLIAVALLACKEGGDATPAATASAAPAAPAGDPRFSLRFGVPKSPEDPELVDFPEKLAPGYVGYKLSTNEEQFPIKNIRNTLYALDGGERQQVTRSETSIEGDMNVFYKSWKLPEPGTYEVVIEDVATGKLVASGRFKLEK